MVMLLTKLSFLQLMLGVHLIPSGFELLVDHRHCLTHFLLKCSATKQKHLEDHCLSNAIVFDVHQNIDFDGIIAHIEVVHT